MLEVQFSLIDKATIKQTKRYFIKTKPTKAKISVQSYQLGISAMGETRKEQRAIKIKRAIKSMNIADVFG